jgi:hypothetical protein
MATEVMFDDQRAREFLEGIAKRAKDPEKIPKIGFVLGAVVFQDVMDHFKDEKGPDGNWAPWSKIYKEHMNKIGRGGNKILQWTGRLRQNFMPKDVRNTTQGLLWFNNAKTKSGFPYAFAHDEGGGKLPARAFMWASDKAVEKMASIVLDQVLKEKADG